MIIIDTNVISEFFRPVPDANVLDWAKATETPTFVTTITLAELWQGVDALPDGARKQDLDKKLARWIHSIPEENILPFGNTAARNLGTIRADARKQGKPISFQDAAIAAICREHGASLLTRNVKDFTGTGVQVLNPWES